MLGENRIDLLDTRLDQFRIQNQTNQIDLQTILKEYGQLLEDYRGLKKSIDENNHSIPNKDGRKPYVVLLVDGNGYIFNDELIEAKENGGMRAARELNKVVEHFIQENLPTVPQSRIIVRVFCDLTNLSRLLAKFKLTGMEKRSLSSFAAGFTRALPFIDFVDAMDAEGTRFKIKEAFKMAVEDSACAHILYAACVDSQYVSQLAPFHNMRNKITLVQAAAFNSDFRRFNLETTQFPTVFRWSDHAVSKLSKNGQIQEREEIPTRPKKFKEEIYSSYGSTNGDSWRKGSSRWDEPKRGPGWDSPKGGSGWDDPTPTSLSQASTADNNVDSWGYTSPHKKSIHAPPCKYYQKGYCRLGNKCTFPHVPEDQKSVSNEGSSSNTNVADILPSSSVPGFIPLNKDGQRIDTYIRPPTTEEWRIYNTRYHRQKICNNFHLRRLCTDMNCTFDHSELEPESRHTLEYVVRVTACPKKGDCRAADCPHGHICQKANCTGYGRGCILPKYFHSVDPRMQSMEKAVEPEAEAAGQNDSQPLITTDGMW